VNPLALAGQAAATANAVQGVQARNALAAAYQNAPLDPDTGLPNQGAIIKNLLSGPAAWIAPDVIRSAQEQQQRQYGLNQQALAQTTNRTNAFNNAMSPLIRLGPNVTPGDVFGAVSGLHASGFPTDEYVQDMAATMPTLDPAQASDPGAQKAYGQQLQSWILNHAARSWSPDTNAGAFRPNIDMVNTGGTQRPVDVNAYSNPGITSMPPINQTLSPGEQVQPVPGPPGPKGQRTAMPLGTYAAQQGYGALVPGAPSPVFGTGRLPAALRNPANAGGAANGAPAPAAPQASSQVPAPMPVGLGPGQNAAIEETGKQGGDQAAALASSANDIPTRQGMLSAMLGDMTRMDTGPNSPMWGNFMGRLSQLGLATPAQAEGQAARENFAKMASQFAQQQAQKLGVITNDKLSASFASNPNEVFTTLGNQGVIHVFQGNEDALGAKNAAWQQAQQSGTAPDDFSRWSTQFNKSFDPRVFWLARMSGPERATLINGMTPPDRQKFQANVVSAVNQGWVDPGSLMARAPGAAPPASPAVGSAPGVGR